MALTVLGTLADLPARNAINMPSGASPLLPVTKVGPGDKERAYVVRQNCLLKFLLGAVIFVSGLSTMLVLTRYEVHVQRRHSIEGARSHREEEHASHMRVMRLSMLLQHHLEDEVHDVALLTTYRAWLMRAVGDYQLRVTETAGNCSQALRESIQAEGVSFDAEIEKLLVDAGGQILAACFALFADLLRGFVEGLAERGISGEQGLEFDITVL